MTQETIVPIVFIIVVGILLFAGRILWYRLSFKVQAYFERGRQSAAMRRDQSFVDSMNAAADADGDYSCAACGSKNISLIAERSYLCMECAYEGGSGHAAAQAAKAEARWTSLPLAARKESALEDLADAKRILEGPGFRELARPGIADLDWNYQSQFNPSLARSSAVQEATVELRSELMKAAGLLQEVQTKLVGLNVLDPDSDYMDMAAAVKPIDMDLFKERLANEVEEAIKKTIALSEP